jgi:hypothetical protein
MFFPSTDPWKLLARERLNDALRPEGRRQRDDAAVLARDRADHPSACAVFFRANSIDDAFGVLARHDGDEPAFARDVERIEAEHLARGAHLAA